MLHLHLSARCATSLLLVGFMAAPSLADDLFVASSNTFFARGNALTGGFQTMGACFGQPQSMVADGQDVFLGDPLGHVYRFDGASQSVGVFATTKGNVRALALRGNELLVGNSDGSILRFDQTSGASLGSWTIADDVTALLVAGDKLFVGSSSGRITTLHMRDGTSDASLVCGGFVTALAQDATDLIVATQSGFVLRMDLATGFPDSWFDVAHDVTSIAMQGGSLLTSGSDGIVRRFNRITGATQGTLSWSFDVVAMAVAPSTVGTLSCYGYDCPCGNTDLVGGCRNSTGVGSALGGFGSASIAADDLTLAVTNMPPHSSGRLFMGSSSIELPFGDGRLCAGRGGLGQFRFPIQGADANGTFQFGPGIGDFSAGHFTPLGAIHAGQTWHFQAWYRNTVGPCGSGFNTTNSFDVTFTP
jgi:hypothetical protein